MSLVEIGALVLVLLVIFGVAFWATSVFLRSLF